MSIIVTGSLAYDNILQFPGRFEEHILPEQLSNLNISFLVDDMTRVRGGCASNIAYSLGLLKKKPVVMATAGKDFDEFDQWLRRSGVDTSLIKIIETDFTASCFITTDENNNQITGFYAGAMGKAGRLSFYDMADVKDVEIAIISPNAPDAMVKYCRECRELGIPFIFDPGHQIPRLTPQELIDCITGSLFTVQNNYELNMILHRTGRTLDDLLGLTSAVIVTKGKEGSRIHVKDMDVIKIEAARPLRIGDPTGSGDAYRAGLIAGYLAGLDLETIGKLSSQIAVYVVEEKGPAEHFFTERQLAERYRESYGEELPSL